MKLLVPAAAVILMVAGCGEEAGTDGGAGKSITVTAEGFAFSPTELDLDAGESVELTFENHDDVDHSFSIEEPSFEVQAAGGDSTTASFTAPEESVNWFCKFHSEMTGTINVGGDAGAGGTETETETGTETDDSPTKDDDMTEGSNENDNGYDY
jgi:plastocyanin